MKKKFLMTASVVTLVGMLTLGEVNAASVQVNKGDTLFSIAKKHNVSVDALKKENKLATNTIYVGQKLAIPGTGNTNTTTPQATTTKKQVNVSASDVLNVRSGAGISHGIIGKLTNKTVIEVYSISGDWAKIKHGNKTGFVNKNYLKDVAPTPTPTPTPVKPPVVEPPKTGTSYTVVKGDSLYRIGIKFGVSYQDIIKWSNLTSETLKVGQVLVVSEPKTTTPPKVEPPAVEPPKETPTSAVLKPPTYVVKSGDYLYKIANETGVSVANLKAYNGLTTDFLEVGKVLKIGKSVFMNPAEGRLTSHYGERWGTTHQGIDIAKPGNVPILAAYEGVVVRATKDITGWGNYVRIKHVIDGQTYYTLYAHMRDGSLVVKEGDTVKIGQQIGLMGSTGNSTGQHLHLELYVGGDVYGKHNIDPLPYFAY